MKALNRVIAGVVFVVGFGLVAAFSSYVMKKTTNPVGAAAVPAKVVKDDLFKDALGNLKKESLFESVLVSLTNSSANMYDVFLTTLTQEADKPAVKKKEPTVDYLELAYSRSISENKNLLVFVDVPVGLFSKTLPLNYTSVSVTSLKGTESGRVVLSTPHDGVNYWVKDYAVEELDFEQMRKDLAKWKETHLLGERPTVARPNVYSNPANCEVPSSYGSGIFRRRAASN